MQKFDSGSDVFFLIFALRWKLCVMSFKRGKYTPKPSLLGNVPLSYITLFLVTPLSSKKQGLGCCAMRYLQ